MALAYDYSIRFQDDGSASQLDDKLWAWIGILRACEPQLTVSYGLEGNSATVSSITDFRAAREWLGTLRGFSQVSLPDDIHLVLGVEGRQSIGTLAISTFGSHFFHMMLERDDLTGIFGERSTLASKVFRSLIRIIRPLQGDWRERRNSVLVRTCYLGHSGVGAPVASSVPESYPSEAIPYGWLLSSGIPNRFPDGIWWFNYWGPEIVAEFGRELMLSLPVPHVEEAENGGFLFWLCDDLFTMDRPEHLRAQRLALEYLDFREHQLDWVEPQDRAWPLDWGPSTSQRDNKTGQV